MDEKELIYEGIETAFINYNNQQIQLLNHNYF